MKNILQILFSLFIISEANLFSQEFIEQNSGVTVNLTSVSMNPTNFSNVFVCGYGGTIVSTQNNGQTWVHVISNGIPTTANLVNIFCIDANNALTTGNIGTTTYVYRTSNAGGNWSQVFSQTNGNINAIWVKSTLTGFMCGYPVSERWSLWKTTNGGNNWDSTGLFLSQSGTETGWNNSLSVINNRIWFGTNNTRIYYSSNFGNNWQILSTSPELNSCALDFGDSVNGYFGGTNSYKTTNGGLNWTPLTCSGSGNFSGFTNGNWPVSHFIFQHDFAVRNDSNIYSNNFGGSNWGRVYSAPAGVYRNIAYSYNTYEYSYAVRSNGGITSFNLIYSQKISSEVPDKFSLSQNYPNPFNPTTKIRFALPKTSFAKLIIYDILGRKVTTLVNEKLLPGTYEVQWDGTNYSSGVYFYKLETGSYSETRKMVLIK